eukprot:6180704-Pleurochrysis_carterae.AAC.2
MLGRPCTGRFTCFLELCVHTAFHTLTCVYLMTMRISAIIRAGPPAMARWNVSAPPPHAGALAAVHHATAQQGYVQFKFT